jgi:hypothetical protein
MRSGSELGWTDVAVRPWVPRRLGLCRCSSGRGWPGIPSWARIRPVQSFGIGLARSAIAGQVSRPAQTPPPRVQTGPGPKARTGPGSGAPRARRPREQSHARPGAHAGGRARPSSRLPVAVGQATARDRRHDRCSSPSRRRQFPPGHRRRLSARTVDRRRRSHPQPDRPSATRRLAASRPGRRAASRSGDPRNHDRNSSAKRLTARPPTCQCADCRSEAWLGLTPASIRALS